MIRIRTLGRTRVEGVERDDAVERLLAQPKRWALVSYLAVEARDGGVTRDQVLGVFWPEHDQRHARGSLRNSLHYLRSVVGRDTIVSVGDHLSVPSPRLWCDAAELLYGAHDAATQLDLYGGDFLEGMHAVDTPEFHDWVDRTRSAVRSRATRAAWHLADRAARAGEWISAAGFGRRAVALAIDIESASQRLIRLLDQAGDRAAALAEHERLTAALREAYGVGPSPETEALVARVRGRTVVGQPDAGAGPPEEPSERPSVAVLPFRNLSGPEGAYFAVGVTEDLVMALAPLRGIRVVSRTSVEPFATQPPHSISELRERLGVKFVLEGSVRTSAGRARVTAQLIDVDLDAQRWAEVYDRPLADLFEVQSDVALQIARALEATLSPREHRRLRSPPTRSVQAYDRYLRARHLWGRRTVRDSEAAIELLEGAVELDPHFALGWVGLADACLIRAATNPPSLGEDVSRARDLLARALALDPERGEAHASLGTLRLFFEGDVEGALREYRRAVALSPGYATAHHWYGNLLVVDGREEEGLEELALALELDPLSPLVIENVALGLYHVGRPGEALDRLRAAREIAPEYGRACWAEALCLTHLGRRPEGVARMVDAWSLGTHGVTTQEARDVRRVMDQHGPEAAIDRILSLRAGGAPTDVLWRVAEAILHLLRDRPGEAIRALDSAFDEGTLAFLIVYAPALDPLAGLPGMQRLLDRLGYTPARWR